MIKNTKGYILDERGRLNFDRSDITSLSELPKGIKELNCYQNKLTSLPELPEGLLTIECEYNKITSLPKLPESLTKLFCYNNSIKYLPELPDSLGILVCHNNPLECLIPNRYIPYITYLTNVTYNWLKEYYYPYIISYEGQKNILTRQPWMLGELKQQTVLCPSIIEEFSYLFKSNEMNLI